MKESKSSLPKSRKRTLAFRDIDLPRLCPPPSQILPGGFCRAGIPAAILWMHKIRFAPPKKPRNDSLPLVNYNNNGFNPGFLGGANGFRSRPQVWVAPNRPTAQRARRARGAFSPAASAAPPAPLGAGTSPPSAGLERGGRRSRRWLAQEYIETWTKTQPVVR